jgi:hypothetical protein
METAVATLWQHMMQDQLSGKVKVKLSLHLIT